MIINVLRNLLRHKNNIFELCISFYGIYVYGVIDDISAIVFKSVSNQTGPNLDFVHVQ